MVKKGNTTGSIALVALNIPSRIVSFSLSNKTGGAITITVYISDGVGTDIAITPLSYSLEANEQYLEDAPIEVSANNSIYIVSSGSVDYYFTIE